MQVSETVYRQTLEIRTDFQLQSDGTNQKIRQQPAFLQTRNWTKQHKTTKHVNLPLITSIPHPVRFLSPLVSFKQRVLTQTAVCGCRLVEARPPVALLRVFLLAVELVYEAEDVL